MPRETFAMTIPPVVQDGTIVREHNARIETNMNQFTNVMINGAAGGPGILERIFGDRQSIMAEIESMNARGPEVALLNAAFADSQFSIRGYRNRWQCNNGAPCPLHMPPNGMWGQTTNLEIDTDVLMSNDYTGMYDLYDRMKGAVDGFLYGYGGGDTGLVTDQVVKENNLLQKEQYYKRKLITDFHINGGDEDRFAEDALGLAGMATQFFEDTLTPTI